MRMMLPDGTWGRTEEVDRVIIREDGRVEWACKHGVGHPIGHLTKWVESWMGVHGCDGCCLQSEEASRPPSKA